jgi:hypothetical protein
MTCLASCEQPGAQGWAVQPTATSSYPRLPRGGGRAILSRVAPEAGFTVGSVGRDHVTRALGDDSLASSRPPRARGTARRGPRARAGFASRRACHGRHRGHLARAGRCAASIHAPVQAARGTVPDPVAACVRIDALIAPLMRGRPTAPAPPPPPAAPSQCRRRYRQSVTAMCSVRRSTAGRPSR